MDVTIYIQGQKLDLFPDESIEINLNAKNLTDLSKVFSDFTQSFNIPASPRNNEILTHWYDCDIDGTFNGNLRIDAYIEVKTLPYSFGTMQLNDSKMKNLLPYSYSLTFFGKAVNLSDKFGDEELSALDLSFGDHPYTLSVVRDAMKEDTIAGGDIYYPLISAANYMRFGSGDARDLALITNEIKYTEFKPAIREIKLIEAIEQRYGVTLTRDFFDRAPFHGKFMWCQKDAGPMKAYGEPVIIDILNNGFNNPPFQYDIPSAGGTVNVADNTITYTPYEDGIIRRTTLSIFPQSGYEEVEYKMIIESNGVESATRSGVGGMAVVYEGGDPGADNVCRYFISSANHFEFGAIIKLAEVGGIVGSTSTGATIQTADGFVRISDQIPQMKVKDYFASILSQFNLIIRPLSENTFLVDTLDNWYAQGKAYDISDLVEIKDIQVKRPDVKKSVSFLFQKPGAVLNAKYYEEFQTGYGDLKATFDVSGPDLKIELPFENLMFERLQDQVTGDITPYQVGYSINKSLEPYKEKPYSFYKNGVVEGELIYVNGAGLSRLHHTATENNILLNQVTNSLNFGSDISTYFYSEIARSGYFNWWKNFIEDLFNRKTRIWVLKGIIPPAILYGLKLNDRLIIAKRRWKIATAKIDLVTNQSSLELVIDLGAPLDSRDVVTPLTVDSTLYTVDSEILTVDMVSTHTPVTSYVINGISLNFYRASRGHEFFEIYVKANTNWTATVVPISGGSLWFRANRYSGLRTGYVRIEIDEFTGTLRQGILRFTIGTTDYDLTITQSI